MAASLRRGSRLGKYRLDQQLGRGSFATVWKARDTVEQRPVALKVTHPAVVEEFGRGEVEYEARIASRLDHPNVLTVRNADWIGNYFVLATDLATKSLAQYAGARRSPAVALRVIRDVTCGLAYAHGHRLLHRDIKPENILLFADGRAAICDFGVSRFALDRTKSFTEAGTLGYMAPEQAYGRPKLTSDVFSLGLIAYELFTGTLLTWPFTWPPENYGRFVERVPEPVQPVLRRAATFDPARRYPDAATMHRELERALLRHKEAPARRRRRPTRKPAPSPLAVEAELFRRRHGARLGMRYACFRCSGPIGEAMQHCPWCGTSENSFRDLTRYPLVCPECERGVRPEWTACPWCYPGRFQGNGRAPRPDPKAERSCTRRGCSGQLQVFMRYCPVCKQKPKRAWSHPELSDRCTRCRWPVSRQFWRFCPWCGRREPRAGTFVSSNGR
ncbi:MAG: serine/threonine-protein kinase [Proteobacteria bacterium]|nr:serine/threonine-protein kinase [Pseudomonadota bacterium]